MLQSKMSLPIFDTAFCTGRQRLDHGNCSVHGVFWETNIPLVHKDGH